MYKPVYLIIAKTSSSKRAQILQVRARDRHEAISKAQQQGAYQIKSVTRN